ncbi:hypothetical protein C1645_172892 [Glomus cerebriforme]|uniref:Uncharacterized protein n=1 Tax=Glomus cerebriforme TaxID=658196 RepID=A0A397TXU1_9GLOM|nr:hypothetical protein C1645_172892 [Glomus cerebriforme]
MIFNIITVIVSAVVVRILQVSFSWIQKLRRKKTPAEILRNEMQHAKTYVEWRKKAHELDK